MESSLRKSWPARVAALGFIIIIVLGNIWATYGITGKPVPQWLGVGFAASMILTLAAAVVLIGMIVWRKLHPLPEPPEVPEPVEEEHAP